MKSPSLNHYANLHYNCKIKKAPCEKLLLDLDGGKIKTTDLLKRYDLEKREFLLSNYYYNNVWTRFI